MNRLLENVVALATELNPAFALPENWEQRVGDLATTDDFLRQAKLVLATEKNQGFFHPKHFKKTVKQKHGLPYTQCRLLTELISAIYPERLYYTDHTGPLGRPDGARVESIADSVAQDGVYVLPELLNAAVVDDIKAELAERPFLNRNSKETQTGVSGDSSLEGAWWIQDAPQAATSDVLQQLALDPSLLGVAQSVLGAMPIHVQTNAWWTFPIQGDGESAEAIQKRNAQWFHQDMEFIDFVKVFVYLSDVEANNGPHVYVKGSVHDYEEKLPGVSVSTRVSDDDITAAFGADRVQTVTGQAGTIAIVNTRGYHKGAPVLAGHRLLLQFEYTSSLYFNPVPAFPVGGLSAESEQLREQYPRLFMNYRPAVHSAPRGLRRLASGLTNTFRRRSKRAA